tara:strand:+ start:739 stop:930 length:192 start_codon:yes stop_codon:yes gene_type:complete
MQLIKYMKRGFDKVLEECTSYSWGTNLRNGEKVIVLKFYDHEILMTKVEAGELADRLKSITDK